LSGQSRAGNDVGHHASQDPGHRNEREEGKEEGGWGEGREGGRARTSKGHKAVLAITSAIMLARTQVTEMEELGKAFLTTVLSMA